MNPPVVIGREATRWHDTMHVGMAHEGLPPRMEDAQYANLGAEMAWVGATSRSVAALAWKSHVYSRTLLR